MKGDINGDNVIDVRDVLLLRDIVAENIIPTAAQKSAGNLVEDDVLNIQDILLLRDIVAGNVELS